jgi:mediator of RNA polymerase II transcription subunit 14
MVPAIYVNAKDLLKADQAGEVAMPRVIIQIRDWWKGGKCAVSFFFPTWLSSSWTKALTIVQLRHKPALATDKEGEQRATSSESGGEGITFDKATSCVRFTAEDIGRCVPAFLEQWERLSKVIVIAGEGDSSPSLR